MNVKKWKNNKFIENLKIKQYPAYPAEFIVFLCVTLFRQKMAEKRYTICILLQEINNVFLGRSEDVSEEKQDFCCKARSATEGFIAVAKNLRGFGRSLYKGFKGDRIWSLLCQTASNLKKFIQLWTEEKIEEQCLVKLGLLT